ncbi:MAG: Ger(x)C family spore germination protein [Alicyclobacillus sp.]|nr:Ger(x)C family spore germination protein [Alicyclobacillus sp.]
MRRTVTALLLCAVCLVNTGCWDSTEIDRLAIVPMTGVDLAPDGHSVLGTLQIIRPSELGTAGGGAPATSTGSPDTFIVETEQGSTNVDPLSRARAKLSRRLFMGHRRVIVIGEAYAREGMGGLIDEILRNPSSRLRTYLVIAHGATAQSVLQLAYPLNRLPSDAIVELEQGGTALEMDSRMFAESLAGYGDPSAPGLDVVPPVRENEAPSFQLDRIAVFREDRLVGWLDGPQSDGYLWILGKLKRKDVTVAIPGHPGAVSARIGTTRSKRWVTWAHGNPQLNIDVSANFDVTQNTTDLTFTTPAEVDLLKSAIANHLRNHMAQAMNALQKDFQADPLDFADAVYRSAPQRWRQMQPQWRQVYKEAAVAYSTHVHVRNTGLLSTLLPHTTSNAPGRVQ